MSRPYYRFPIKYEQDRPLQPCVMRRDVPAEAWTALWARMEQTLQESVQYQRNVARCCIVGIPATVIVITLLLHGINFNGGDEVMLFVVSVVLWMVLFLPIAYVTSGMVVVQVHHACWEMNNELERYGYAMEAIATRFTADDAVATWESDPRDPRLTLCLFPLGQSSSIEEQVPPIRQNEARSAYRSVEIHRHVPFFFCSSVNSISHSHLAGDFTMHSKRI
jgi:hypothetical protein